jgi:polyvinyl alcohol dehydrogenase (cytochrome)
LKWAFGYPDTTSAWGKPTVAGGRLFVGGQNGTVFSLDARSGCVAWTYAAAGGVRTAISIGPRAGGRTGYVAYFSDQRGYAYALDADSGAEIWKRQVDAHPLIRLTGSPVLYDGRLFVPTSSYEEAGKGPDYNCCTFRGALVALDAATGDEIWRTYTINEEPRLMGRRENGVEAWGPSGGAIWSAPTIDVKRRVIYAGVGNTYSGATQPATDAVAAFDLETGKLLWARQVTPDDVYGCRVGEANCGEQPGPDFDFGGSPSLARLPDGRDLIVIGQKSGVGWAMDPDRQGEIVWRYQAGRGGALGGVEWGSAVDAEHAYFPIADANQPQPGGLHAVRLATGERVWHTPAPPPICGRGRGCNGAQSAAITVIPGVVFSGSVDGGLRAFRTSDGAIVWTFDSNREFATVNGVRARGGSLNGPSPTIVDGMVYANSGYSAFGTRAGNVLLAFEAQ